MVDALAGDSQHVCHLLPGPAQAAGPFNVEYLELVGQPPKRLHRPKTDGRIAAHDAPGQVPRCHLVSVI